MRNTDSIRSRVSSQRSMKSWLSIFGLLSSLLTGASGQENDDCACSPSTYEFVFDFNLFCPPVNITLTDAVEETSCSVGPFDNQDATNLIPVSVQSIDILELGQDLRVLVQETLEGNFVNGDSFRYESISNVQGEITSPVEIPRAIQLNIVGVNVNDESIINVFIVTFTNDCGTYPVLVDGQSIGWTFFRDLGRANGELCPIAATPAPTGAPTGATEPPFAPTVATEGPSVFPTAAPSLTPTMAIEPPVVPTVAPTLATEPPIVPTVAPTMGTEPPVVPTLSPSMAPSDGMMSMPSDGMMSMDMEFDLDDMIDDEFGRAGGKKSKKMFVSDKIPRLKVPKASTGGKKEGKVAQKGASKGTNTSTKTEGLKIPKQGATKSIAKKGASKSEASKGAAKSMAKIAKSETKRASKSATSHSKSKSKAEGKR